MTASPLPHQSNVVTELAWADFLVWAVGNPDMRQEFEAETGLSLAPATSMVETLVDEATGASTGRMREFIRWATIGYFGIEYIPVDARKMIEGMPDR